MNPTDRVSIIIVTLFYILTLSSGYMIYNTPLSHRKPMERLILTINSDEINWENQTAVVYEESKGKQPVKKTFPSSSILTISATYEQEGYELEHITEFLKKSMDQEILVTRMWFLKTN